ncbi:hypothetical protein CLAFUR0_03710 [Fulvia fulva]|nr:hypothetical protein CLAFUR0_03710 [Fulvia fulva]
MNQGTEGGANVFDYVNVLEQRVASLQRKLDYGQLSQSLGYAGNHINYNAPVLPPLSEFPPPPFEVTAHPKPMGYPFQGSTQLATNMDPATNGFTHVEDAHEHGGKEEGSEAAAESPTVPNDGDKESPAVIASEDESSRSETNN